MLHEEDGKIICPYDTSHSISRKRMQFHLVKCQKNYPTKNYAVCPMDTTHHVPEKELAFHVEICPKRYVVDSAVVEQKTEGSNITPPLPKLVVQSLVAEAEESWDDVEAPTYVPDCSTRNVFRTLKNAPRAEKKEFQRMERLRLLNLLEKEKATGPIQRESQVHHETNTVRMPKNQSQALTVSQQRMTSN